MEVLNRTPYYYNSCEEDSAGGQDEIAIGQDDFSHYAKKITEDKSLADDYEWNVGVATNEDKKTDDDKKMDYYKETNGDKTEET